MLGISASPGIPDVLAQLTLNAPYNDADAVETAFAKHPGKIAAVIVEPVAANMGVVSPTAGFLQRLRSITQPDLSVLGKVTGAGLPVVACEFAERSWI